MECKEFKSKVADLFDKSSTPAIQAECERHMAECAQCRQYYHELADTADMLRPKHSPCPVNGDTRKRHHVKQSMHHDLRMNKTRLQAAAAITGILLVTGITLAAILNPLGRQSQMPPPQAIEKVHQKTETPQPAIPADTLKTDTAEAQPVIFDNVPLDQIVRDIAAFHHLDAEVQNQQATQLRFYFVWKREDSLQTVVEQLNQFEQVNIVVENEKMTVR